MGMQAELIAVGPYSPAVKTSMDYDDGYDEVPEGTQVICTVVQCATSEQSRKLARALGMDAWKFQDHYIEADYARRLWEHNKDAILEFVREYPNMQSSIHTLLSLATAGFEFYFRPQG